MTTGSCSANVTPHENRNRSVQCSPSKIIVEHLVNTIFAPCIKQAGGNVHKTRGITVTRLVKAAISLPNTPPARGIY
jgi:hypothetical protein